MKEVKYRSFNLLSLFLLSIGIIGLLLAIFAISDYNGKNLISVIFLVAGGVFGFLYFLSAVFANRINVYEDRLIINYWKNGLSEATSKLNSYKTEQRVIFFKDIRQFRVEDEMFHIYTIKEKFSFEIKLYSKFMLSCFQYKIYQKTNVEPRKTDVKLVHHNYNTFIDFGRSVIFVLIIILIAGIIPWFINFSSLLSIDDSLKKYTVFYFFLQLLYLMLSFIGGIVLSGVIYSKFIFGKYSTEKIFQENKVIEKFVIKITVFIYLITFTILIINLLFFKDIL